MGDLRAGDLDDTAQKLWGRYFDRLARLARAKLRETPRGPADEEDVALSAFESLIEGAAAGAFPQLGGRDDLRRLLVTITARKAANQRLHEQWRGGGHLLREASFDRADPEAGSGARARPSTRVAAMRCHLIKALG